MKVFITGITGMVGSCFYESFLADGHAVKGLARSSASSRMEAIQDKNVIRGDISDRDQLESILRKEKPDLVIHMAAQAFNGMSWDAERFTHMTNYMGTLNLLQVLHRYLPETKLLLACSSAEYGFFSPEDCPLKEERPLKPVTPYGVSKAGIEQLGFQFFANYGMPVYLPRMFIHVGTGHPPATAIQNFARQLALIKKGKLPPVMHVGNLTTARDFIDVRDGVAAMRLVLEKGNPGEPYNICTGTAWKISEILDKLIAISGMEVEVITDPGLLRASDEVLLLGDNSKIRALGFEQKYSIDDTLEGVFADWMARAD